MKKSKKVMIRTVIVLGVIILPLAYSLFYLGAFWDPYSRLDSLSVAVVNQDQGAEINGTPRNLGDEMEQRLRKNDQLKWVFTNANDAAKGVDGSKYYAVLTIPKDFSSDIASASTTDKKTPTITYTSNEKKNFLAAQIINRAVAELKSETRSQINRDLTSQLADQLKGVPDQLGTLDSGLGQLSNGAGQLKNGLSKFSAGQDSLLQGATSLNSGLGTLNRGAVSLQAGLAQLQSGMERAGTGSQAMLNQAQAGLGSLSSGIGQLKSGAGSLSANVSTYTQGVQSMINSTASTTRKISGLLNTSELTDAQKVAMLKQALAASNTAESQQKLTALSKAGPALASGAKQLSSGADRLASGASNLSQLTTGMSQLSGALKQLDNGAKAASNGAAALQSGLAQAGTGSEKLVSGAKQLSNSSKQLSDGADALSQGLGTAKDKVHTAASAADTSALNGLEKYAADPVNVKESPLHPVPNYGTAFAPYFMSLSLYVGALILFVGIYLDADEKIKVLTRNSQHKFVRVGVFALIGVAQAVALGLLVRHGLGLTIVNVPAYYLSCILVSIVFISIVEFFFVNLKDAGKFLSMLLLILQLTSCGGTFPMETVPKFFQVLYPYMPMTYSVQLFKEAISGYNGAEAHHAAAVLILFFALFTGATILFSLGKKGKEKLESRNREKHSALA